MYLSTDVTGALVSHPPNGMVFWVAFLCTCVSVHRRDRCTRTFLFHYFVPALLFRVHAPPPCETIQNCNSLLLRSSALLSSKSWSVPLCPFGGFVVPLMRCPAGLLVSFFGAAVGASRCLPGSVALLSVLGWAPLVLSCCLPFLAPLFVWC